MLRVLYLSCYCGKYLEEKYDFCENKEVEMVPEVADRRTTRSETSEELTRLMDLICQNMTVAIAAAGIYNIIT